MSTSTQHCLKKQKQRITLDYIEFTHPFRKHSLKTYSVLGTITDDKLFLKGSNSRYFRLCGSDRLLQLVNPTNVAATDNIERNGYVYVPINFINYDCQWVICKEKSGCIPVKI